MAKPLGSMHNRRLSAVRIRGNLIDQKRKKPSSFDEGFSINSLTMSYFHTGIRTIIGAEAFHCPVRDGKEWDHLAMVIRLNLLPSAMMQNGQFAEPIHLHRK
jgi:hypothetical protein